MAKEEEKKLARFTNRELAAKRKIYESLSPQRQAHHDFREHLRDFIESLLINSEQINEELKHIIGLDPITELSAKYRSGLMRRFEFISRVVDDQESSSAVLTATSPHLFPVLLGISHVAPIYPEEAHHLLKISELGIADDFVFTTHLKPLDRFNRGLEGVEIRRNAHVFMRHSSLAKEQGLSKVFPKTVAYEFNNRDPKNPESVADKAYISDGTPESPIPPKFFAHFGPSDFPLDGENSRMLERWLVGDMLTDAAGTYLGLANHQIDLLSYLQMIREGFTRNPFLDNLIAERGYRL